MTAIDIAPDETLQVTWNGRTTRGGLFQIMAEGNAKNVNVLGIAECMAVLLAVKIAPFPLGAGEKIYRLCLQDIADGKQEPLMSYAREKGIGIVRKSLVERAGGGCNAPHDSYISIAAAIARTGEVPPQHRY